MFEEWPPDFYYTIKGFFKAIRRALAWGWKLRNSQPWDSYFLLELEVLKLEELLHYFENYGIHAEDCENYGPKMRSLRLAIKLGHLLHENHYMKAYERHYAKWGAVTMDLEPIEGSSNFRLKWTRDGKPHEPCEQESAELKAAFAADEDRKQRHRRLFYNIIALHGERWWD